MFARLPLMTLAAGLGLGCASSEQANSSAQQASSAAPSLSASAASPAKSLGSQAPSASAAPAVAPPPPAVAEARAEKLLFPAGDAPTCAAGAGRVRCLVEARYAGHPEEQKLALALFDQGGDVAGQEEAHQMDGGFRGVIRIVPELPVKTHRRHLAWVANAQREQLGFIARLEERAKAPIRYRVSGLGFRFLRSVGRTTPSAYATNWEIGYNVSGSLHANEQAVVETIVHEVFHLNDQAHNDWSRRKLGPLVDQVVLRCKTNMGCLKPYAPGKTTVRGGTYYAFQPGNGDYVNEYAAELATRYFLEQQAASKGERFKEGAFKCGPEPNPSAWKLLAEEFFGGVDETPICP